MQMAQTKFQYTLNSEDPVRLFQYIFSYENTGNYALFNFHNQYKETLRSFSFIVKQYDKEEKLLVKSRLEYNDLEAKENSFFVPKLKLTLDSNCDYITVEVDEALFTDAYYFEGEMKEKVEEIEEEKFDPSTLPYFKSNKKLMFEKPIFSFTLTCIFTAVSFLLLYLYLA